MDSDSQKFRENLKVLKEIDFELAYLVLLTRGGLKPLSRWEKPLDNSQLKLLQQIGLLTREIKRTVKIGKGVIETIFSASEGYIELYEKNFADTPVDKSALTVRFEGFLFGFPPCCVDEYIKHPYAENSLKLEEQKILFHWACRNCRITPILLPAYQKIHSFVMNC